MVCNDDSNVEKHFQCTVYATDIDGIVKEACVQYERFIKSYSGLVPQGRKRTLWDIVKPDNYDMMISEITGLVKMKNERLAWRPTINCAQTITTNASCFASVAIIMKQV
eukprot:SAG11_NODE_615_length_8197_cov_4.551426_1_plen_109_part_00